MRITRLGVYFSRHGELVTFDVAAVIDESELPLLANLIEGVASRDKMTHRSTPPPPDTP